MYMNSETQCPKCGIKEPIKQLAVATIANQVTSDVETLEPLRTTYIHGDHLLLTYVNTQGEVEKQSVMDLTNPSTGTTIQLI